MSADNKQLTTSEIMEQIIEGFDINLISDDVLSVCLQIIECQQFKYGFKTNEKGQMVFENNLYSFCGTNTKTMEELSDLLSIPLDENCKKIFKNQLGEFSFTSLQKRLKDPCDGCHHSTCFKGTLAALVILKQQNKLDAILKQRKQSIGFFKFKWEPEMGLREVPEDIFQIAKNIIDNNELTLSRHKDDDGNYKIKFPYKCDNPLTKSPNIKKLSRSKIIDNNTNLIENSCNSRFDCQYAVCPFLVAAYIYYLKKSGQEDKIQEDRQYYHEHEDEILKKVNTYYNEKRNEHINSIVDQEILHSFDKFKDNIHNIEILSNTIANKDTTSLYFAIEREDGIDDKELVNVIINGLEKQSKVNKNGNGTPNIIYTPLSTFYSLSSSNTKTNTLYVITDLNSIKEEKKTYQKEERLVEILCDSKKDYYIILTGTHEELVAFYERSPKLKYIYEHFCVQMNPLTIDQLFDIYKANLDLTLIDAVNQNEENVREKFNDFAINNRSVFPFKNTDFAKYIAQYSNARGEIKFPPYAYRMKTLDEALSSVIGMEDIKEQMKELEQYIIFTNKAKAMGLKNFKTNLHMIFTGNPGCGKTMMARIMVQMLYDIGAIRENKFVEVDRKDLIAKYIGQTAPKTAEVIDKAMGGVLFIDEAYSLTQSDSPNDYGQEAIATLIKAMEDRKGEFVVIFAGYKKEMKQFVDSNPGIASRIGYTFHFNDYSADELLQIFECKIKNAGFELTQDALDAALKIMKFFHRVENIGNGRFVDRLIQNTLIEHAKNTADKSAIQLIGAESIPSTDEIIKTLSNNNSLITSDQIDEQSVRKTAIHEIGHAYIRYKLYKDPQIVKITINPEGCGTLGYVEHKIDNQATHSKTELLNKIKVSLAGMACEQLFNGEFENGNGSDLQNATNVANNMVTKYGMSNLGFAQISNSNQLTEPILKEVNNILNECYKEALDLLLSNKQEIQKLVEYLLDKKEITGEEFMQQVQKDF